MSPKSANDTLVYDIPLSLYTLLFGFIRCIAAIEIVSDAGLQEREFQFARPGSPMTLYRGFYVPDLNIVIDCNHRGYDIRCV